MATKQLGAQASNANDLLTAGQVSPKVMGANWTPPKYRPGYWHMFTNNFGPAALSVQGLNDTVYVYHWVVTDTVSVTHLSMQFQAQGSPNTCIMRTGLWRHDTATQAPGQLIAELGSFSGGSGNGGTITYANPPSMPVSLTLQPGMYWIGFAAQGATTPPQFWGTSVNTGERGWDQPFGTSLPGPGFVCGSYFMSNVSGALSDFRVDGLTNISPRFTFRMAA